MQTILSVRSQWYSLWGLLQKHIIHTGLLVLFLCVYLALLTTHARLQIDVICF